MYSREAIHLWRSFLTPLPFPPSFSALGPLATSFSSRSIWTSPGFLTDNKIAPKSTNSMKYLDLTLADAASNLACDEALVELFETRRVNHGLLRIWESEKHFVVLGHSNKIDSEVDLAACESERVSIFRRLSGGGTV